jgi:AcrR family transcriptional regulator
MTDVGAIDEADDPMNTGTRRRGRRPAGEDTRAALLAAAREVFAEQGYNGATVRAIAARAGVDPAMVNHWFGGKSALFASIIEVPFDPAEMVEKFVSGDVNTLGERIMRTFVTIWDTHEGRFPALINSISNHDMAGRMLQELFTATVFGRITDVIDAENAELRAALCASQIIGLGVVRYVLKVEPVASATVDELAAMVGPNLQHYLTGDVLTG